MGDHLAELFKSMGVDSFFLLVVAHAFEVALFLDFLDDLVHVCFDIAFHVLDFLEGF